MSSNESKANNSCTLSFDEIKENAKHDLDAAVDKMTETFSSFTNDSTKQLSIRDIEDMMTDFISETRKISLDAISDMLSNYDEREIITSKKENSQKEG